MSKIPDWESVICAPRQGGKTHAMAQAVKACDGVMVCRDATEARRVAKEYGVRTVSVQSSPDRLRGQMRPTLLDTDSVAVLLGEYRAALAAVTKERDAMARDWDNREERLRDEYLKRITAEARLATIERETRAERIRGNIIQASSDHDQSIACGFALAIGMGFEPVPVRLTREGQLIPALTQEGGGSNE